METLKYYIPVTSASLPHYFGKAIILPSAYFQNKPKDPQDQFSGYLMFSENKWIGVNDCTIEVIITTEEKNNIRWIDNESTICFYDGGIPISRIVSIYFKDRKQSETTQWNINSGTAFLPDYLIKIENESIIAKNIDLFNSSIQLGKESSELVEKAKRFDILLGGISFLKAATREPANFPKDYFSVLSHFNLKIKVDLFRAIDENKTVYNDQLTHIFSSKKSGWSEIQPLIFDEVTISKFELVARKANVKIEKKYGLIDLEKLEKFPNLYILGLLATYGANKQKSLQDLISKILMNNSISEEKMEEIALIFGLNSRYSGLKNTYNGKDLAVKFEMLSKLDYYTIESIFQYTFNGFKESSNFEYLETLIGRLPIQRKQKGTPAFWILDTPVILKEKRDINGLILEHFRASFPAYQEHLEKILTNSLKPIFKELEEREDQIRRLEEMLVAHNTFDNKVASMSSETGNGQRTLKSEDELEQLDFKSLKALAKSSKIPAKIYNNIKPTYEGFASIINLIRAQKTLL